MADNPMPTGFDFDFEVVEPTEFDVEFEQSTADWIIHDVIAQLALKAEYLDVYVGSGVIEYDPDGTAVSITAGRLAHEKGSKYICMALKAKIITPPEHLPTQTDSNFKVYTLIEYIQAYVQEHSDALIYKGTLTGGSTESTTTYTPAAEKGYLYKVSSGAYINKVRVDPGDVLICNSDATPAGKASNVDTVKTKWDVVQTNIDTIDGKFSNSITVGTRESGTTIGDFSSAEGYNVEASGEYSFAEGTLTHATGEASHAEGYYGYANGDYSHSEGNRTAAYGKASHVEGSLTVAGDINDSNAGKYAHAEGNSTTAVGEASHAEGADTIASGVCAHAEGSNTKATGNYSHAEGEGTTASAIGQHSVGRWNIVDRNNSYVEIVGNGTDPLNLSNARTLDWNGNEVLLGKLTVGAAPTNNMDVTTKQYVDNKVSTAVNALDGSISGSPSKSKTLTAFSETNGVVSATFGNIAIPMSQVTDIGTAAGKGVDANFDNLVSVNLPTTAAVASYIEEWMTYQPITINTLTVNPASAEHGSTVTSATFTYAISKLPKSAMLDADTQTITTTSGSFTKSSLSLTSNKTWTLQVTEDKPDRSSYSTSKTVKLTFMYRVFYGAAAIPSTINSAFVRGLSGNPLDSDGKVNFTATAVKDGQTDIYVWYASTNNACSFNVGGFDGGFESPTVVTVKDAGNNNVTYYVYRSTNPNLGTISVTVK